MTNTITLSDGTIIPTIGFGTWQLNGSECRQAVETALAVGYRHIDTADRYGNHKEVGAAIAGSGLDRSDLFLTTKVWHDQLTSHQVSDSVRRFLVELQTEYIDLLLIHWPNHNIPITETLQAMQAAQQEGIVRSIGVSNFTIRHLEEVRSSGSTVVMNQVEYHPSLNQQELLNYCTQNAITVTAYSPIAQGQDLNLPVIQDIAKKHDKTPAQVILNWLLYKDIVVIPRSTKPERIRQALESSDFVLSDDEYAAIDAIGGQNRLVCPDFAEFS